MDLTYKLLFNMPGWRNLVNLRFMDYGDERTNHGDVTFRA